jgi:hypothetical protein
MSSSPPTDPLAGALDTAGGGRRRTAVIALVLGIAAGVFGLLFVTVNSGWVVISLPSPPWDQEPSWPVFEARLSAVMLVSALCGGAVTCVAWWAALRGPRGRQRANRARILELERELENVNRLLAATREKR